MADRLFDTTVFIDYQRGHEGARRLLDAVITGRTTASFSPVTVFELWVRPMERQEELRYLAILSLLEEATLTANMTRMAGFWLRGRPRISRLRLFGDALIAATAAERGEAIYTRNVSDFQRFYPNVHSY